MQNLKVKLNQITEKYVRDEKASKWSNLEKNEKEGLVSMKKKVQSQESVVFQTDKSGRLSVDSMGNYRAVSQPHVVDSVLITKDEHNQLQQLINAHSAFWVRILNAGSETNSETRIKNNMLNSDSQVAPLYTLRKDHKEYSDEYKGPPVRPVCGAVVGYNCKLSHLVSVVLTEVWKSRENSAICTSTEDMIAEMNRVNQDQGNDNLIIGSTDVIALYPSLDIEFTIDKVCEVFYESKISIRSVNSQELGLYLALTTSPEVLARMEITNVCPTRKTNRGRPPTITASGSEEQKEKRFKSWNPPVTQPDERAKRIMLKEALRAVLTVIMKNHVFTFDNKIRKQIRGGPIGLKLTGVLAQIFMIWWDKEFATRLNKLAIVMKMNKRYVDDINMAVQATPVGMRYKDGKTHMDERSVAEDQGISDDERTMTLIKQIGNDIHPSIQLEIDYPSKHQDGKLPILDLKVWMETTKGEETDGQDEKASVIMYEFYSKSMASKTVIHARSAVSWSTKRTVLTQEVLRVLLNCSRLLPWERVVENVNEMVLRMQYSGYSKKFRYEVVDSALKAFRARQRAEREGERPLHRPKEWRKVEREKEKSERKSNWYKRGGNESVIFVPATPNSRLRKEYQKEIKQQGFNIKVVEKAGIAIKRLLQKSDPFKPRQCEREDCPVCSTGGKGPCDGESVTYEIKCIQCNSVYVGETARSAYTRGKEHTKSLNNKEERSALWKHCKEKHNSEVKQFRMDVTGVYHNDAMLRQITEGVRINNVNEDSLMNSKNEWNFFQIPRAVIDTS